MTDWKRFAVRLAGQATSARSRWQPVIADVPRHVFVPYWWRHTGPASGPYGSATWSPVGGAADTGVWMAAAYADRSLVTRVGAEHADHAVPARRRSARRRPPRRCRAASTGSWRLVTTIAGTGLLLVADATPGRRRRGPDRLGPRRFREDGDGGRTAVMAHPDGSWARAAGPSPDGRALVHQGGPRRLWDQLDDLRARWLADGSLPVYGARAKVTPDGAVHLRRGGWQATIS